MTCSMSSRVLPRMKRSITCCESYLKLCAVAFAVVGGVSVQGEEVVDVPGAA